MRSVFLGRPEARALEALVWQQRSLLAWIPALLGVAVIAVESTATFSAANTSSWLRPVAERMFGPFTTPAWESFHHLLRKSGHFAGYGTLCVLFLRGWLLRNAEHSHWDLQTWWLRSWMLALLSTFLVASCDEWHQSFLPSRTGLFSDVVLDTCGGVILSGLVLGLGWYARRGDEAVRS